MESGNHGQHHEHHHHDFSETGTLGGAFFHQFNFYADLNCRRCVDQQRSDYS